MRPTLLVISQVYPPDPAAVGQHLHDAARELVSRGWRVRVIASAWGHHEADQRYPAYERLDQVEVQRIPFGDLGKRSMAVRLLGAALFLGQATGRALIGGSVQHILVSTSPPLAPPVGALLSRLLRAPLTLWMMDINPDQAVLSAGMSPNAPQVRALDLAIRRSLRQAANVVTLDRFMAQRLASKTPGLEPHVLPPWPLAEQQDPVPHADNPFRKARGWTGKRVIMFSGNISATHPVDTLLLGLLRCPDRDRLAMVFIGSGTGLAAIQAFCRQHPDLPIGFLPYQPLSELRYSLSAADVHLISMGDDQVGIVHPCKVYGVMALQRPFIYLGPPESHIADIVERHAVGWQLRHGDIDGTARVLGEIARCGPSQLEAAGALAGEVLRNHYSRRRWLGAFCDLIEQTQAE